jgi:tetratricopeptide (TPR) repeat protein
VLRELERQSLISQTSPGRWQLHDLVKLYAAEEAHRVVADGDGALRRLVDHLNDTAHAADCVLNPRRANVPSVPGSGPDSPVDLHAALRWFETEYAGLREAQQIAYDRGWSHLTWQLARNLDTFHWRRNLAEERFAVWRIGVAAADRLDDSRIRGRAARLYGDACIRAGRHEEGLAQLERALRIAEADGDESDIVQSLTGLAHACAQTGDPAAALRHATRSLDLARRLDNPVTVADRLNAAGWYSLRLGHTDDARRYLEEALALIRHRGHPYTEAAVLDSVATLEAQTGCHEKALARYEEAIPLIEEAGDIRRLAELCERIGDVNARLGRTGPARTAWRRALALFEEQHCLASATDVRRRLVEGR